MDLNLIKKLQAAGVEASVILGLILDDESQSPAPAEVTPEPAAAEPEPEVKPAPAAKSEPDPIMEKLDRLIGTIQASNILRDGRGADPVETVDDILAQMITPTKKEG